MDAVDACSCSLLLFLCCNSMLHDPHRSQGLTTRTSLPRAPLPDTTPGAVDDTAPAGSGIPPPVSPQLPGAPSGGRLVEDAAGHLVWQPASTVEATSPAPPSVPVPSAPPPAQPQRPPGLLVFHPPATGPTPWRGPHQKAHLLQAASRQPCACCKTCCGTAPAGGLVVQGRCLPQQLLPVHRGRLSEEVVGRWGAPCVLPAHQLSPRHVQPHTQLRQCRHTRWSVVQSMVHAERGHSDQMWVRDCL